MMELTRLIVLRHGETAWNVGTRIQGQLDIGLNATGLAQAGRLGEALGGEALDAVYASDLSRAWATAEGVARHQRQEAQPIPEPRLRERAFGCFEGLTFAEIESGMPAEARLWRTRDPEFAPAGGGESLLAFRSRVIDVASELAARHAGGQIALVAHGGVMDVLYRAATGQGLQAPRTWHLGNAAINRLLWTPQGFTLVGWGDTRHLTQLAPLDEPVD
ncbi:histidine phosphatase family protein [Variovorax sp. RHLX14]|uniref:histidine phosphatase family protein n=1 Tax=Variovorax sp. RHLX14 TaxID=1259731 RepID=UPI003F480DF1